MFYDNLTGLPNVILFIDRLQQSLARAERRQQNLALICLEVNSAVRQGLSSVDDVINEVARRLGKCVLREEDTVARICGDQFGIILGDIDGRPGVCKVLDKIFRAMEPGIQTPGQDVEVTISAGVALYPHCGKEWSSLLRSASATMHLARESGGNACFCAEAEMAGRSVKAGEDALDNSPERWNVPQQGMRQANLFIGL